MKSISSEELDSLLVEQAILRTVRLSSDRRTATLTFEMNDGGPGSSVILHCESVFQVCLATFGINDFSSLGISARPVPEDLDQVVSVFADQHIFEWEFGHDRVVDPSLCLRKGAQVFLMNDAPPPPPYRGIAVFKDTEKQCVHLYIVGKALVIET